MDCHARRLIASYLEVNPGSYEGEMKRALLEDYLWIMDVNGEQLCQGDSTHPYILRHMLTENSDYINPASETVQRSGKSEEKDVAFLGSKSLLEWDLPLTMKRSEIQHRFQHPSGRPSRRSSSTCPAASNTEHVYVTRISGANTTSMLTPLVFIIPRRSFLFYATLWRLSKRSARERFTRLESVRLSSASQLLSAAVWKRLNICMCLQLFVKVMV